MRTQELAQEEAKEYLGHTIDALQDADIDVTTIDTLETIWSRL